MEKQELKNILVIVTRYFGGILLGTGGLVRAYSEVTMEALVKTKYTNKSIGYEVIVETSYPELKQIKYELEKENIKISNIEYGENVELMIEVPEEKWKLISNESERLKFRIINRENTTKKYIEI